jgi:RNA polymerase sigma-70 factor (ECF subfamily)
VTAGGDSTDSTDASATGASAVAAALTGNAARAELIETATRARASRSPALDGILDELARRAGARDDGARDDGAGRDAALELLLELVHRLGLARPAIAAVILDHALVDDVAQTTLMTVERTVSSYEGRARFRTWLHTVARNEALMAIRRRQADPMEDLPAATARFSSVLATRLSIEALVDGLPEPYRETLRLQLFGDLDYDAIAERLAVPVGTVRSRLSKARELLRNALGERVI